MGSGYWDANTYASNTTAKIRSGTSFAYSSMTASAAPSARKAHNALNVKGIAVRESRDSTDHPNAVPIYIGFDVTGSMGIVPQKLQAKLKEAFSLLLRKGYVEDPQILVSAIGDGYSDTVPFQAGQFESDNRVDDQLDLIYLEGNGGGGGKESYGLAYYFLGHKTATDAWEKRSHKGYAFIIGDEKCHDPLARDQITSIFGDTGFEADIPLKELIVKAQEQWEIFHIIPVQGSYPVTEQMKWWSKFLPEENILILQEADDAAELIAVTIGMAEGTVDLDTALDDLTDVGSSAGASVSKALAKRTSGGSVVLAEAPGGLDLADGSERV